MKDENVIENLKKYNQTRTLKILENVDETIKNKIIETEKEKYRLERNNVIFINGWLRKIDKGPLEDIHRCERRLCYFYDSVRRLTEIMEKVDE